MLALIYWCYGWIQRLEESLGITLANGGWKILVASQKSTIFALWVMAEAMAAIIKTYYLFKCIEKPVKYTTIKENLQFMSRTII